MLSIIIISAAVILPIIGLQIAEHKADIELAQKAEESRRQRLHQLREEARKEFEAQKLEKERQESPMLAIAADLTGIVMKGVFEAVLTPNDHEIQ